MEIPPYKTVAAIIQCHREVLGLEQIDQIETALLGQGEANLNVLVTVNQAQRFNLRIGLREAESERTLQREYDVLQLVPAGIGPRAFVVDLSRTQLNQPYMLLDYLAGELKTASSGTEVIQVTPGTSPETSRRTRVPSPGCTSRRSLSTGQLVSSPTRPTVSCIVSRQGSATGRPIIPRSLIFRLCSACCQLFASL